MLETSPAGIAIFVPRGDLLFVNARYVHLFGYRDAEQARSAGPPPSPSDPPQAGVERTRRKAIAAGSGRVMGGGGGAHHQRPIIYHGRQAIIAWYVDITSQVAVEEGVASPVPVSDLDHGPGSWWSMPMSVFV